MKRGWWVVVFFCIAMEARAQLAGLLSPAAGALTDNVEQLADLQALIMVTQKGYGVTESGLMEIGDITGEELWLHEGYIASLSAANPVVAGMPEVKEIVGLETACLNGLSAGWDRWKASAGLSLGELELASSVYAAFVTRVDSDVGAMTDLLTPGRLVMTDAERVRRVVALDAAARVGFGFVQEFCAQMDLLVMERQKGMR